MAIEFRAVRLGRLTGITASAPGGAVIGVVGLDGSGKSDLLKAAFGAQTPASGEALSAPPRVYLAADDPLEWGDAVTVALDHTFARKDAFTRARAAIALEALRRRDGTALLVSHEPELVRRLADEVWWLDAGRLAAKGDPGEVLERYQRHTAARLREWGAVQRVELSPRLRQGDRRAEILSLTTLDDQGRPTVVWQGGSEVGVEVVVRYHAPVADPVVGILIRTRIGFEVYGTNTELEKVRLGPCGPGDVVAICYRFRCGLCPQEYTLTAASHDPDGVWHDWMEDGIAFSVVDDRYTAGVTKLEASVTVRREPLTSDRE